MSSVCLHALHVQAYVITSTATCKCSSTFFFSNAAKTHPTNRAKGPSPSHWLDANQPDHFRPPSMYISARRYGRCRQNARIAAIAVAKG